MTDSYDLKALKAPTTAGTILRLSAHILEGRFPGNALAGKLLKDVGMDAFREATCPEALSAIHPLFEATGCRSAGPELHDASPGAIERSVETEFDSAADFVDAYQRGITTPCDVAERLIEAIERLEGGSPSLGCVIEYQLDDIRRQAASSSNRYKRGETLGPLDGVPIGVKDELDLAGYRTRVGTSFMGSRAAGQDAFAVGRLRQAGALLFGKLNMHEIGIGVTGVNPHHGAARNPHDLGRVTGGSSSGSASAIAAGLCPISVGADGGGSIRIPAALCGVVGLKPTFGRVSENGAAPLCWSVAHVGPLGATVHDTALAYLTMAGRDPADPNTLWQPPVSVDGLKEVVPENVTLGVFRPWFEDAQTDVVNTCDRLLERLQELGIRCKPVDLPELGLLRTAHMVTISTEMRSSQSEWLKTHRTRYGCDTRLNLALAQRITADDYIRAQRLRSRFFNHFMRALEDVDAIVTPTTAITAPTINPAALSHGESNLSQLDQIMRFAPAANLTGLPALSVPIGMDRDGLPIGIQLTGSPWSEGHLLGLGQLIESQTPNAISGLYQRLISA